MRCDAPKSTPRGVRSPFSNAWMWIRVREKCLNPIRHPQPDTASSLKITGECVILTHRSPCRSHPSLKITGYSLKFSRRSLKNTRPSAKNTRSSLKITHYSLKIRRCSLIFTHRRVSGIQWRSGERVIP